MYPIIVLIPETELELEPEQERNHQQGRIMYMPERMEMYTNVIIVVMSNNEIMGNGVVHQDPETGLAVSNR